MSQNSIKDSRLGLGPELGGHPAQNLCRLMKASGD